jgi:hypothetical protein
MTIILNIILNNVRGNQFSRNFDYVYVWFTSHESDTTIRTEGYVSKSILFLELRMGTMCRIHLLLRVEMPRALTFILFRTLVHVTALCYDMIRLLFKN